MIKPIIGCFAIIFSFAFTFIRGQITLVNSGKLLKEGSKLHDEGEYKKAIVLYSQISRSDTNYSKALYELSMSSYLDSNFIGSRQYAEKGLQLFPEKANEWYSLMGSALDDLGKTDSALYYYDKALQLNPHDYSAYFNKGVLQFRQKKVKEAKECFQMTVLVFPYYASAHYYLGVLAEQEGNLIPAMLSYTTCLLINPQTTKLSSTIINLTNIAKAKDKVLQSANNKKSSNEDNFDLQQEILLSRISLDEKYKLQTAVEDPIVRQLQVTLEKLEYNPDDKGFWMQYYVPFYQNILSGKQFDVMINYMFSGVNIKQVQEYNKKNKQQLETFVRKTISYFDAIKTTRIADAEKRKTTKTFYTFDNRSVNGKGEWRTTDKGTQLAGPWEFYYSNGQVKSKGTLNDRQNKEGSWIFYNENGTIDEQNNYIDGKLEGKRLSWYNNGLLYAEENYKAGELEGLRKQYYYNGLLRFTELYSNGKKNGTSVGYDIADYLYFTCNYKNDELDGELRYLHYNGKTASVLNYKAGKADGVFKKYNDHGTLIQEGNYVNENADGVWKEYYDNGKLYKEYNYNTGKMDGVYNIYYDNGKLIEKLLYVKDELNGKAENYDEDGILFNDATYEKGRLREINFYDKNGKILGSTSTRKGDATITFFGPQGYKTNQGSFTKEGLRNGKSTYYYSNGEVSAIAQYKDGNMQGEKLLYYLGGAVQEKLNYVDDKEDGSLVSYYKNGKLKYEGVYAGGDMQGDHKAYNELGNIISAKYYLNDAQNGYTTYYHPNGKVDYEQFFSNEWLQSFVQYDTLGAVLSSVKLDKGKADYTFKHYNGKDYIRGHYKNYYMDGPYEVLFFDGTQNSLQFYKNGYADSVYKQYHYGGKLKTEGSFVHGNKTGDWKYYYSNGNLYYVERYTDGKQNGKEEVYNEDGTMMKAYNYLDDMLEGEQKIYGSNNELAVAINYHKGKAVSYTYTGKDGQNMTAVSLINGTGKLEAYYKNGTRSAEINFVDGDANGKRTLWYSNGKPYVESKQDEGYDHGIKKTYSPGGQLIKDEIFLYGSLNGIEKYYYASGKIRSEENWHNGNLYGANKYYDENGRLQTRQYYFGLLQSVK